MKRFLPLLLILAGLLAAACVRNPNAVPVQPITEWEASQIGAQSMNQTESWEPNVEYETQRDGKYWKVTGYKTRGKDLQGKVIYEPGVYRVIKISPYGKVIDFWRHEPKK